MMLFAALALATSDPVTATSLLASVPILDLSLDVEAAASIMSEALHKFGFFYVKNHRIPQALIDQQFEQSLRGGTDSSARGQGFWRTLPSVDRAKRAGSPLNRPMDPFCAVRRAVEGGLALGRWATRYRPNTTDLSLRGRLRRPTCSRPRQVAHQAPWQQVLLQLCVPSLSRVSSWMH